MSAFKRRTSSKQPPLPSGTRLSPGSPTTIITSTGIPSLDDILGGGLPLSCSLLVLAPDAHSAYGELVLKYFAAEGLAIGQRVCVVDSDPATFLSQCMWMPGTSAPTDADPSGSSAIPPSKSTKDEEDEKATEDHDAKIKIAWRYEGMKQFQTTVPSPSQSSDDYCRTFDLTCRIPDSTIHSARTEARFLGIKPDERISPEESSSSRRVLRRLAESLIEPGADASSSLATRICIPALGSYEWGDLSPPEVCHFLLSLRRLLRHHPRASAAVCIPPHLCQDTYGGPGWVQKLGFLTDASITLAAFSSNPSLSAMFSSHHGLVHIHSLPAPHTLLPPSDKFSTLRGLTSSGENNLAFKCTRKRLIFETLHLDVEGGVSERRTAPSTNALPAEGGVVGHEVHHHAHESSLSTATLRISPGAAIQVQMEQGPIPTVGDTLSEKQEDSGGRRRVKAKKKVAFTSERPDLYDF